MLAGIVEIEMHLTRVGVRKPAELEIDNDQATESPMVEQEVDTVPGVAYPHPPLTTNESEITAEFKQERLDLPDERRLEICLRILVFETKELQDDGSLISSSGVIASSSSALAPRVSAVAFLRGKVPSVRRIANRFDDRADERSNRPAAPRSRRTAGREILHHDETDVVRPGQSKSRRARRKRSARLWG